MKTWLSNLTDTRTAGIQALDAGANRCVLRTRMIARLPSGVKAADCIITTRIEVTFGERAAGAMRGETRQDIAARETLEASVAAGTALSVMVQQAAERTRVLRAEAEKITASIQANGSSRKPWRARALASDIRDMIDDHVHSGTRALLADLPKDVLAVEAWLPVAPPSALRIEGLAERVLAALKGNTPDHAIALLTEVRDAFKGVATNAFEVWGDPLSSDITMMTTDVQIRHLLTEAVALRDRAAEFAGQDPENAAAIIARADAVEKEALDALMETDAGQELGDLLDSQNALEAQAGMRFNKR